ncbi:SirB2 family protein [Halothiobacillus sp.]|uniref:SirB2 family protein n=1 Tax=Halothiobacillus sp. TaxID=1891311 RepID=UPI00261B9313|nr:SirB2 family protein [Halothiobacillus sp.]MDD4966696.1 SirB2 family protein [Halothiobacillus sp.]
MTIAQLSVHIHGLAVVLSLIGFILRGIWMLQDSPRLKARWVRITPHIVDTVLLLSALIASYLMFWRYGVNPDYVTVMIVGLIVYIVLGLFALRLGKTKAIRASAWVLAIAVFLYISAAGALKTATPFLSAPAPAASVSVR